MTQGTGRGATPATPGPVVYDAPGAQPLKHGVWRVKYDNAEGAKEQRLLRASNMSEALIKASAGIDARFQYGMLHIAYVGELPPVEEPVITAQQAATAAAEQRRAGL